MLNNTNLIFIQFCPTIILTLIFKTRSSSMSYSIK